jgi:hypothetical protein
MMALRELPDGTRFEVENFPEGRVSGSIDVKLDDGFVAVVIDGDEEVSVWPEDTEVTAPVTITRDEPLYGDDIPISDEYWRQVRIDGVAS